MRKAYAPSPRRLGWLVVLLAAAALLSGGGFAREAFRARQIDREIGSLKAEAEALRVHNFQVASLQASLASGEFLEREARMKLGLQKAGEHAVVLRKNAPASQTPPTDGTEASREEWSNLKKWWNYFADPRAFDDYVHSRLPAAESAAADHPSR